VPGDGTTETGPLDAWAASYLGQAKLHDLKSAPRLQTAIAGLQRRCVVQTDDYPWCSVCSLVITDENSEVWVGSGWLAGPRTVITAGHCVYLHDALQWARQVEVFPGRNGESNQRGYVSTDLHSVAGWTQGRKEEFDYGAVILREPITLLRPFDYRPLADGELTSLQCVNLFGYPGEKARGTMWGYWGRVIEVRPQRLGYRISTSGGQSGGPVWVKEGGDRYVVGIHNYGGSGAINYGTRLTPAVQHNIRTWLTSNP
jgi:V8-like Glu-specific endopeptidase